MEEYYTFCFGHRQLCGNELSKFLGCPFGLETV